MLCLYGKRQKYLPFISAGSEPGNRAGAGIWRMPRGSDTTQPAGRVFDYKWMYTQEKTG
jgi:hypothetical protein